MFREELGWFDRNSGLLYTNIFDAMVDAVSYALNGTGYPNMDLLIGEVRRTRIYLFLLFVCYCLSLNNDTGTFIASESRMYIYDLERRHVRMILFVIARKTSETAS